MPLTPPPAAAPPFIPRIRLYQDWLQATRGLRFADYDALVDQYLGLLDSCGLAHGVGLLGVASDV